MSTDKHTVTFKGRRDGRSTGALHLRVRGNSYRLKRGEPTEVPVSVVEALRGMRDEYDVTGLTATSTTVTNAGEAGGNDD